MMRISARLAVLSVFTLMACSPSTPQGQITAVNHGDKISGDTGLEMLEPKVDILFIVDSSGSMDTHQRNLAANIGRFMSAFFSSLQADFHVGVITTDDDWGTACCGRLIGVPAYVERSTPNFQAELARRLVVGTSGATTEKVFDPLYNALTDPNMSTVNAGFYRQDAYLAIVIITDAEDQSTMMRSDTMQDFLVKLKGTSEKILSYGVLVPTGTFGCARDEGVPPTDIERFLSFSPTAGSNEFSLCDPLFGDKLAGLGKDLASRIGNFFYLQRVPVLSTIVLTFGTQIIPFDKVSGWSFDSAQNAILLGPKVAWSKQPPGTKLLIRYESTEHKDKGS